MIKKEAQENRKKRLPAIIEPHRCLCMQCIHNDGDDEQNPGEGGFCLYEGQLVISEQGQCVSMSVDFAVEER